MSEFKIEKGIPLPRPGIYTTGRRGYPFQSLDVGDSFFLSVRDGETAGMVQRRLAARATVMKRDTGKEFATRQVDGGVRVWRVA